MIRIIIGVMMKMRTLLQKVFQSIFVKFQDEKTGKVKGISPKSLQNLALVIGSVFFLGILVINMIGSKPPKVGGLDDFRKEMTPRMGVSQESTSKSVFGEEDPLEKLVSGKSSSKDSNGNLKNNGEEIKLDEKGNPIPSISECLDLIDKLKNGTDLKPEEKKMADTCIEQNIAQMSAEDLAAIKMLMRDDLSDYEKDLLRKKLAGQVDPESLDAKILDQILKAAKKGDEAALDQARQALAALDAKNAELAEALLKRMQDDPMTPREKDLVSAFDQQVGKLSAEPKQGSGLNSEDKAKELAKEIAERESQMKALADELAKAQAEAARAGEKIAKGLTLTPEEQAALKKLTELQAKQAEIARQQELRRAELAKLMNQLQKTLTQVTLTMKEVYPSGISVELNENLVDCENTKALPFKRTVRRTPIKKKPQGEVWLSSTGEALTPDKIKMIQLYRMKKANDAQTRADLTNPLGGQSDKGLGEKLDVAQVLGEDGGNIEIASLTVFADKALKPFSLTPDMKIPAVLDSEILISDKGSNQMVRVRIIDDIHNPETGEIVIPKGSIAIGSTSGFDGETGIMDLNFDKVVVGSGKTVPVKFSVGSADGTMGLKGQVRDTRGKFLLGAFITSFSAGALNWFSQQIIQDYITRTDAPNALLGATMQGGSDVMTRIAELYAGDLQNAAKIFYVPRRIPVVLFPN